MVRVGARGWGGGGGGVVPTRVVRRGGEEGMGVVSLVLVLVLVLGLLWAVSLEIGLIHGGFLGRELIGVYFYGTALYSVRDRRQ